MGGDGGAAFVPKDNGNIDFFLKLLSKQSAFLRPLTGTAVHIDRMTYYDFADLIFLCRISDLFNCSVKVVFVDNTQRRC